MSTNTSIGSDPSRGGNDNPGNADGCGNKTLGSHAGQQPPAAAQDELQGTPEQSPRLPGVTPRPGVPKDR